MYKKIVLFIVFPALFATSCRKDPGLLGPTNVFATTTYPQDTTQLFSLLVPVYANLRINFLFGFELKSHGFDIADHTGDLNYNGLPSWNQVAQNSLTTTNNYAEDSWVGFYRGIQMANTFLAAGKLFEQKYAKPSDIASLNIMRGEAHFLRALYYFYAECFFGESYIRGGAGGNLPGLPILASTPTALDSTQVPRSTVRQTWDFIISDLQQAATLLHGVTRDQFNQGRATEWSAKSLLGKVYVYTQDWANAKTTLLDVINNSGKTLMPTAKYMNAFGGDPKNEFNEESLFELNVDPVEHCYGVFCGDNDITTSEALVWSPVCVGDTGTEGDGAHTTGYANLSFHDRNLARFGFNLPVQDLVKNPSFNPAQPKSPTNSDSILDPAYLAQSLAVRASKTVDPRLYLNALQPWVDSSGINDYGKPLQNRAVCRYPGLDHSYYGWSFHKYAQTDYDINTSPAAASANIYVLRMADVYLLYAEACANTSDNANAIEYLNKVKRRAYGFPFNGSSPVDYKSLTDTTSAHAAGDPVLGNNPLYYERYAELMNEANWWFDVCRWKIGASEAAWYKKTFAGGPILWNDVQSYVWPIPAKETDNNTKMVQNPGY